MDISVISGDFSSFLGAWYAREMGFPIANIICSCNDNNAVWELFHNGQLHTDTVCKFTSTPEADITVPVGLEQLIWCCGGLPEVEKYILATTHGRVYFPEDTLYQKIRNGIYVSVISERRMQETVLGLYRSNNYLISPYAALSYAGVMDYRVNTGENRNCLIWSEKSPECDIRTIAAALHIPQEEILEKTKNM